jgi:hypothetical protein
VLLHHLAHAVLHLAAAHLQQRCHLTCLWPCCFKPPNSKALFCPFLSGTRSSSRLTSHSSSSPNPPPANKALCLFQTPPLQRCGCMCAPQTLSHASSPALIL